MSEEQQTTYSCVTEDCAMEGICLHMATLGYPSEVVCSIAHDFHNTLHNFNEMKDILDTHYGEDSVVISLLFSLFNIARRVQNLESDVANLELASIANMQLVPFGPVGIGVMPGKKEDDDEEGGGGKLH